MLSAAQWFLPVDEGQATFVMLKHSPSSYCAVHTPPPHALALSTYPPQLLFLTSWKFYLLADRIEWKVVREQVSQQLVQEI